MLSPSITTKSNGNFTRHATICRATSFCGPSPRPESPMTANLIDPSRIGGGLLIEVTDLRLHRFDGFSGTLDVSRLFHRPANSASGRGRATERTGRYGFASQQCTEHRRTEGDRRLRLLLGCLL